MRGVAHTGAILADLAGATAQPVIAVARPRLPPAAAVLPYLERIDDARWYSNFGPLLSEFETRLADRFGPGASVVTAVNATQGLTLALRAMDLPAGALCAVPAWTFVATAHAVCQAGLVPWFVDVDPETWMLDPDQVREALPRAPGPVGAVVPVAAFGRPLDLSAWTRFRDATGVAVLVDAAAAFDTATDAELPQVVSLHATKVVGVGEGGFLACRDEAFVSKVRQLTSYGFLGNRVSAFVATNAKLSEYTAAVGHAALDSWPLDRLRWLRAAQVLKMAFTGLPEVGFQPGWGTSWITSVCTVTLPQDTAAAVEAGLREHGVDTRRWWGEGCHRSPAFKDFPCDALGETDRLAASTIGLPFAIDLHAGEAERIAAATAAALGAVS